jgi:hypothetical protein
MWGWGKTPMTQCTDAPWCVRTLRRRAVVAAGDYVHEKTPLRSVFPLTSIAPTHAAVASVAVVDKRQPQYLFTVFGRQLQM